MKASAPRFWLVAQNQENWEADRLQGGTRYGMSQAFAKRAGGVSEGDFLLIYVPTMMLAGARKVVEQGLKALGSRSHYREPYPYYLATEPTFVLPEGTWVDVRPLLASLTFPSRKGPISYRQSFRSSIRGLPQSDGQLLMDAVKDQADLFSRDPFSAAVQPPKAMLLRGALKKLGTDGDRQADTTAGQWRILNQAGMRVPFLADPVPGLPRSAAESV